MRSVDGALVADEFFAGFAEIDKGVFVVNAVAKWGERVRSRGRGGEDGGDVGVAFVFEFGGFFGFGLFLFFLFFGRGFGILVLGLGLVGLDGFVGLGVLLLLAFGTIPHI